MKLIEASRLDSIADYAIREVAMPVPGPQEVLIEVLACGVGYVDSLVSLGRYQVKPALPANLSLLKGAALVGVGVRQFLLLEADKAAGELAELLPAAPARGAALQAGTVPARWRWSAWRCQRR